MLMENGQMPPVQPMAPFQPASPAGGAPMPGGAPIPGGSAPSGMPMVQQVQVTPAPKKDIAGLIKTIAIVVLSLIAVTFIGLFIWMFIRYDEETSTVDDQINVAVAEAKDEQATLMNEQFLEREKNPYKTFSGPADYGQLTFEYPKTWSVYIENDAAKGGDFNAYFNPVQVNAVGKDTINALRVTISTTSYDEVVADYQRDLERKNSNLTVQSVEIGDAEKGTRVTANRYTGTIPSTDLSGIIVVFKIRDKSVILQTDSSAVFAADFDNLLNTITFNA